MRINHRLILIALLLLHLVGINVIKAQQVPPGINYQGIAKDASGTVITNRTIAIRFSIYSGTATGTLQWQETHTASCNEFGLFTLVIGKGASTGQGVAPSFSAIPWGSTDHWLKTEMDVSGGNYVEVDNTQLLSVPYALYSAQAGKVNGTMSLNDLTDADTSGIFKGAILKWNGSIWKPSKERDSVSFAYQSQSAVISDSAKNSVQAGHSNYSDTATYALNCTNPSANDWHINGNAGINAASHFIGTTNAADLVLKTNNTERMRLTSAGKVGVGVVNPSASFHVSGDDGFIAEGTYGSGTAQNLGAGNRLMWYPKKAAFRAGYVLGTNWDDVKIGNYSFATGYNTVATGFGAVAMGQTCQATDSCAIALGAAAVASGRFSVAMGNACSAGGFCSVALGRGGSATGIGSQAIGYHVLASGAYSTAFGNYTIASGDNSVAMGFYCSTNNMAGSFVFADNTTMSLTNSTAPNQFMVKASGGTIFYTNSSLTAGVSLAAGSGAWSTVSDKRRKEHFKKADGEFILSQIADMDISSWNYKTQDAAIRHLGPTAQDFYKAFQLGESDTTITTTDIDGISMAAIQALAKRTQELNEKAMELEQLKMQVKALLQEKAVLEKRLTVIENRLEKTAASLTSQRN